MPDSHSAAADRGKSSQTAQFCERLAARSSAWTGSTTGFIAALVVTVLWRVTGPMYGYSDTWQLVINTVTSVVTFLMVFLIQRSQNRDMLSLKIQLSELIAAMDKASNSIIDLDTLSEQQLEQLHKRYLELSRAKPGCEGIPPGPARTAPMAIVEGPAQGRSGNVQDAAPSGASSAGCTPGAAGRP